MSASLIGRSGSSAFKLSMSLAGSCFSPESAHRPFHHGIRRQGGTIFQATLPIAVGRSKRTCELLAPVYGWFTEGLDTRDLNEAKALLNTLAS
jgi:predicted ATPase